MSKDIRFSIGQILYLKKEFKNLGGIMVNNKKIFINSIYKISTIRQNKTIRYNLYDLWLNCSKYNKLTVPDIKISPYRYYIDMFETLQDIRKRKIKKVLNGK